MGSRRPSLEWMVLCLFFWVIPDGSLLSQITFFVAPNGSDRNPGTLSAPFLTVSKARDAVRTRNQNASDDIIVYLRAGDYYCTEPVSFEPADSGFNQRNIIYRNYDALGSARLLGGTNLAGWVRDGTNIYKTHFGTNQIVQTLFENGRRSRKARFPNYEPDPRFPVAKARYLNAAGEKDSHTILQYKRQDFDPQGWDLSQAQVYIWSGGWWEWFADILPIVAVNPATQQITVGQQARYPIYQMGSLPEYHGSRYFLQGSLDFLDQTGEFFHDSKTGWLYYWPWESPIEAQTIFVPTVKTLIALKGDDETNRVHNICFEGLTFEGSSFGDWFRVGWVNGEDSGESHLDPSYDHEIDLPPNRAGLVFMHNTDHIRMRNCHLKNSGYSAIYMLFYNQFNEITGNWIEHCGHMGIAVQGRYPGEGDVAKNHLIADNLVHDTGELLGNSHGIALGQSSGNRVIHNEIFNGPRLGVGISGYPSAAAETYGRDNYVGYTIIHHEMQDSGGAGALYGSGFDGQSNLFEQILVRDIHHHPSGQDLAPLGVHMDDESGGQYVRNIKVHNIEGILFFSRPLDVQHLVNVSWQDPFDETRMDYSNIGLTTNFLYRSSASPLRLSISNNFRSVVLSWPIWAKDHALESADALTSNPVWHLLPAGPITVMDQLFVTNSASAIQQFFRLKQPPR